MPLGASAMGPATRAIKAWSDAGLPKKQLLLGVQCPAVAADGTLNMTTSFDPHNQTKGDA